MDGYIGLFLGIFLGFSLTYLYYASKYIRENPPGGKHYFIDLLGIKLYPTESIDFSSRTYLRNVKIPVVDGEDFRVTVDNWIEGQGIKYFSFAFSNVEIRGI